MIRQCRGRASIGLAAVAFLSMFGGCAGGTPGAGGVGGPGSVTERRASGEMAATPSDVAPMAEGNDAPRVLGPDPPWRDPEAMIRPSADDGPRGMQADARLRLRIPGSALPSGYPVRIEATAGEEGPPWPDPLRWMSDDVEVVRVTDSGVAIGYLPGVARIMAVPALGSGADTASLEVTVVSDPARILTVSPARATAAAGEVLHLTAEVRTVDGRELQDPRVHWSATPIGAGFPARIEPDGAFVAPSPGTWLATATRGRLSASAVVDIVRRPGEEALSPLASALPPGPAATFAGLRVFEGLDGRDWAWVWTDSNARIDLWDISEPAAPAFIRSVDPAADRIHEVEIGSGGRWAVAALSGPSDDGAGLVVFDLTRPSDPVPIARVAGGLRGGASSVAVDRDRVWAASIATGSLIGIDLSDPASPRLAGSWRSGSDAVGHIADIEVRDGFAFLARWADGVAILDVGAGIRGGTDAAPVLVAEVRNFDPFSSPGISAEQIRALRVHRWREWLLVGESIEGCPACDRGPRGGVRLIDLTDLSRPAERAWYRVPDAGVRDLEVDARAERLTTAFGTGGVRRLDVGGEMRGDLYRQGRETAAAPTGAWFAGRPGRSLARGARTLKGSLFVADMYSGLRVYRIESQRETNDREPEIEP